MDDERTLEMGLVLAVFVYSLVSALFSVAASVFFGCTSTVCYYASWGLRSIWLIPRECIWESRNNCTTLLG